LSSADELGAEMVPYADMLSACRIVYLREYRIFLAGPRSGELTRWIGITEVRSPAGIYLRDE